MAVTARHSGKVGDIIFSLPLIKKLGIDTLYVPERTGECEHLYSNVRDFLLQQPYLKEVKEYKSDLPYGQLDPAVPVDYDLDLHRTHMNRGERNMVLRFGDVFKVKLDQNEHWLIADGEAPSFQPYHLVNVTPRHRGSVNFREALSKRVPAGEVFFIGTRHEHLKFCLEYGDIRPINTYNLAVFAWLIKHCESLYCNQSASLAIAQGLGVKYFWERKPGKTNCVFSTPNAHEL